MKEISRMALQAKKALDQINNGKTLSSSYVNQRLEKAADNNPRDILICTMRDVVAKYSSNKEFLTQNEIASLYDELYGFSGGKTAFRNELGDLLPRKHARPSSESPDISGSRANEGVRLDPLYSDNELSKELSGVFSLDSSKFASYGDNSIRKAEKFAKVQLTSLGCAPREVRAIKNNDHFVLCNASYDMSDYTQVNVKVPVQITSGIPRIPTHFVDRGELSELNQQNLLVHIKDSSNHTKKNSANKFAQERSMKSLSVDSVVVPASLEKYADLENDLIVAASSFSRDQVGMATSMVAAEVSGMGVLNPQVKVAQSDSKNIVFDVEVSTRAGRKALSVPVEMHSGSPILPSKFSCDGNVYEFNKAGFSKFANDVKNNDRNSGSISRYSDDMSRISYHELMDKMIEGVSSEDYRLAEDALSTISSRFDNAKYLSALDKFSKLLKHSSNVNTERDDMIKEAVRNGDLISVPTSVELYCPKLGLPVSKVSFDDKGRPMPMRRKAQADNLFESGAAISTSKIFMS